jgi:hypothetical protein
MEVSVEPYVVFILYELWVDCGNWLVYVYRRWRVKEDTATIIQNRFYDSNASSSSTGSTECKLLQ